VTVFVPFWACYTVHKEAKFVNCLLNDEQKQNYLSVCKDLEDKAKRTVASFLRYPVARDENPVSLWEMDVNGSCFS
jgi:hypothetical protein